MNRFEKIADRITRQHGVHVTYQGNPSPGYVLEGGHREGTARGADRKARLIAAAANRSVGYIPPSSVR